MAEFEKNNTRGIAVGGLTTGIIGTALASANSGLLGNIFGGCRSAEEHVISRYELGLQSQIDALQTEVKLRDANTFTLGEMDKLRNYIDVRIGAVERELADQRVYNATNIATVNCINNQVAQLMALTKLVVPIASICPTPAVAANT